MPRRLPTLTRSTLALVAVCTLRTAMAGYTPPADSAIPDHTLSSLHDDLAAARWSDAVDRIETALAGPPMLAKIDDRLLPIAAVVNEQLTDPAAATAFAAQYEKTTGPAASAALSAAVHDGDTTAIARVAARYPWSQAAAKVPAVIANRLAAVGDLQGTQSVLRTLPAAPSSLKPLADLPSSSDGKPISFAAPWYSLIRPFDYPRTIPLAGKDVIFIASPSAVAAINLQGKLLWTSGAAPTPIAMPDFKGRIPPSILQAVYGERSLSKPALWCDPSGVAKLVLVRQSSANASVLTAYRADSGALIWTTADSDISPPLMYMGVPLIDGRYIYSLALSYVPPALPKMSIVALDLPNGRVLWRSEIGDVTPPVIGLTDPRANMNTNTGTALLNASSAELTADDKAVYASLEGGSVTSLDRFSGQTNWIAAYPAHAIDFRELMKIRLQQAHGKTPLITHRWHDRVVRIADMAVVAPTDSTSVLAFNAASGKQLWKYDAADGSDLIGMIGDKLILAGAQLTTLKTDGTIGWQVEYTNAPAGPAFIDGPSIITPTESGITTYAGDTGKSSIKPAATVQSFEIFLKQPATKKALDALALLEPFNMPPGEEKPAVPEPKPNKPEKKPGEKTKVKPK